MLYLGYIFVISLLYLLMLMLLVLVLAMLVLMKRRLTFKEEAQKIKEELEAAGALEATGADASPSPTQHTKNIPTGRYSINYLSIHLIENKPYYLT